MNAIIDYIFRKINEIGSVYVGDTNYCGARHGFGKMIYIDGTIYEGDWLYGLKHGKGMFQYKDGSVYRGYFVNDLKEGEGEISF